MEYLSAMRDGHDSGLRWGRMRRSGSDFFRFSLERGTLALCGLTTLMTLVYAFAPSLRVHLEVTPQTFGDPKPVGLIAHGVVSGPSGALGLLFLVALGAYFMWSSVRALWYRSRATLIGFTLCAGFGYGQGLRRRNRGSLCLSGGPIHLWRLS